MTVGVVSVGEAAGEDAAGAGGGFSGGEEEAFVGDFADLVGVVEAKDGFGDEVEDCWIKVSKSLGQRNETGMEESSVPP